MFWWPSYKKNKDSSRWQNKDGLGDNQPNPNPNQTRINVG